VLQHPWGQRDSIMPRSKEDDAARKREERSARYADDAAARSADDAARKPRERSVRPAARQHRPQHHLARSKEDDAARKREECSARSADDTAERSADDAARKREERSARSADDAAARSSDDAARKREERSARSAARQHRLRHRLAQEAATLGAAMTVAAAVDDPVAVETAPLVDETPSAKLLRSQTRITDLKANFHDSLPKKPCAIQQQPQQPFDNSTKEISLASGLAAVQRFYDDQNMFLSEKYMMLRRATCKLQHKNRKPIITHVTCAEAGRGKSGPARQHAHVLPSVHCSRERKRGQFVDRSWAIR